MRTALDADPAQLDKHEQHFVEQIRKHGWVGTHVASDDEGPGFSYTTGFWLKFKFPELILFSLGGKVAHDTFWHMYRELDAGRHFPTGELPKTSFKILRLCFFLYRSSNIDPTLDGVDGFMEAIISFVFNWCFRIRAGTFLGHQNRPRASEQPSPI
jgi:hypothetical protein